MPDWLFNAVQFARQLWVRAAIFSAVGLIAALVAVALAPWVPQDFALKIGTGAVDQVLGILAMSMLSVATFSLATLVTAYTAISASATPRAATLMVEGGRGQSALATFVGAFIYAVTGIFALQTGYYGAQGRVILFFFTVGVLIAVITALLRWIDQLSRLGRVGEAIDRVADATRDAFDAKLSRHGRPPCGAAPDEAIVIVATAVGYVRNIDVDRLEALAAKHGLTVFVDAAPGDFVHRARPLFRYDGRLSTGPLPVADLTACWNIGDHRSFDQDPRFGLTVLGEIAARALSPAINDPGTAIDVISTAVRLLSDWAAAPADPAAAFEHLRIEPLSPRDLLRDVFTPIAQYGASTALVASRLQTAFAALTRLDDPELARAAVAEAALALARAEAALSFEDDRRTVRDAAGG